MVQQPAGVGNHVQADHAMTRILAIMQNQWFRDPQRAREIIDRLENAHGPRMRRRFISHALFAGSVSGRRLQAAFGDLCDRIEWEECSREISGHANFAPNPDPQHVTETIVDVDPHIIITFGTLAWETVQPRWAGLLIKAPHPAARGADTMGRLRAAAKELKLQVQLGDDMARQRALKNP